MFTAALLAQTSPQALEAPLRLGTLCALILILYLAELLVPLRPPTAQTPWRMGRNLLLMLLSTLAVRLIVPISLIAAATWAETRQIGLFHLVAWPQSLELVLIVVLLDLAMYAQHVASHYVPILWRLHSVHHCDAEMDFSTGVRFHPGEILFSLGVKLGLVLLLGASAWSVLVFELLLSSSALVTHARIALPQSVDRSLRWIIVTPKMHEIHHSQEIAETNSNYGFFLAIWDRLFRTYITTPAEPLVIGLKTTATKMPRESLWRLLLWPIIRE